MMSRWLLNYSPAAVVVRLLATNGIVLVVTSLVLDLSGASSDPRLLLPAWISIALVRHVSLLASFTHLHTNQIT